MKQFSYRTLPEDYCKDIYICDVDKTYLRTNFESLSGLLKILIESSIDKRSIPGVKNLLLELRKGAGSVMELFPIYFITASPLRLKKVLEGKFLLDGVQHDGIILKDYWRMKKTVGKLRFKNNFTYKLVSLLTHRLEMPSGSTEILFGDDYEKDADVYSLYADILSAKVDHQEVKWHVSGENLDQKEMEKIFEMMDVVQKVRAPRAVVQKIFIHMIRHQDIADFKIYGSRLAPTRNYIQTAAMLYSMEKISKNGFQRVANSFNLKYPKDGWTLEKSLRDLRERGLISKGVFEDLALWK